MPVYSSTRALPCLLLWAVVCGLPRLTHAGGAPSSLLPSWTVQAQTELRSSEVPRLWQDTQGFFVRSMGPPDLRVAVDAAGNLGPTALPGRSLPINGGSADLAIRRGDICFNNCFVAHLEIRRYDSAGELLWTHPLPFDVEPDLDALPITELPGIVVVGNRGAVFGLDSQRGALRWFKNNTRCTFEALPEGRVWQRCAEHDELFAVTADGSERWRQVFAHSLHSVQALGSGRSAILSPTAAGFDWIVLDSNGLLLDRQAVLAPTVAAVQLLPISSDQSAICISSPTGKRVDRLQVGLSQPRWSYPITAPDALEARLYGVDARGQLILSLVTSGAGRIEALRALDGGVVWTAQADRLEEQFEMPLQQRAILPGGPLIVRGSMRYPLVLQPRLYGIDLTTGAVQWRRDRLALPTVRENSGVLLDDRFLMVELSGPDTTQPLLLVSEWGLDGTLLRQSSVPMPLFSEAMGGRVGLQANADRILVGLVERPVLTNSTARRGYLAIDRHDLTMLAVVEGASLAQPALDHGYLVLDNCATGTCTTIRYFVTAGTTPTWQLATPSGFTALQMSSTGVLFGRDSRDLLFLEPDGSTRFQVSQPDRTVAMAPDGSLLVASDRNVTRLSLQDGQPQLVQSSTPIASTAGLAVNNSLITVFGYSTPSYQQHLVGLYALDLQRLFTVSGELASMTLQPITSVASKSANATLYTRSPGEWSLDHRVDDLQFTFADTQVLSRRSLLHLGRGTETGPNEARLAARPDLLLTELLRWRDYNIPLHQYRGYRLPPITGNAKLKLTQVANLDNQFTVRLENSGPSATRVRLQASLSSAEVLEVTACRGAAAAIACGQWPGLDLPPTLELPGNASVEFDLRLWPTANEFGIDLQLAVDADTQTSEVDRSDNRLLLRHLLPMFQDGFE